ncbi:MAG: NDP-sugar synthase [Candidatus Bathyarchaeia archaeon]
MSQERVKTAIILAGGAGLRLRPLTQDIPKAMINVSGKPLLQWIIEWLKVNDVRNIVVGVAYKKRKIMEYFKDGEKFDVEIKYSTHTVEGGTSEGFKLAIQRHVRDEVFLAMNCDELVDIDVNEMLTHHRKHNGVVTVAVGPLRSPYGVVKLDGIDVIGFDEKPILKSVHVSTGVYVFSRDVLRYLSDFGDVERIMFPKLSSMRKLKAYHHNGFWATVNSLKDLQDVETQLQRGLI